MITEVSHMPAGIYIHMYSSRMLLLNFCNLLQVLYGKFLSILNKLTPQKFQKLAEQARELAEKMNTQERMDGCVEKLFHKVSSLFSLLSLTPWL